MTAARPESSSRLFWIFAALCLAPWFFVQVNLSINGDTAWLLTAAARLLSGAALSEQYFEVNPPLSILYHVPPAALAQLLPGAAPFIPFFYFCALIALSTAALAAILRRWDFIDTAQAHLILCAWLAANTIFTTIAIGEREHIVLLGLMPLAAAQLTLTWRPNALPRPLLWAVLIGGAVAVLIKPHFGLIPALLLIHRATSQRRLLSLLRAPDFVALAVGTLLYAACVWLFFRDYVTVILPDLPTLYIATRDYAAAMPDLLIHAFLFLAVMLVDAVWSPLRDRARGLLFMFYAGALLCLIPYAVQMKGFYYQLLPALGFFFCGFALSLHGHICARLKKLRHPDIILIIAVFALAYANRPPLITYPAHGDFKNLPLAAPINNCPAPCPVFIFNDSIEIMHPVLFYSGLENASRFPTFWFLPPLLAAESALPPAEVVRLREKYSRMVAADFVHFAPRLLILGRYRLTGDTDFDFGAYFSADPAFAALWQEYEKIDTLRFPRRAYFAGTRLGDDTVLTYDIYRRRGAVLP